MSIDLDQVVLDGGRRFVNFFEGRILTGRDLRDEQTATRQGRAKLGQAIGYGVSHGLRVLDATPTGAGAVPAVQVTAGLGINREGQTIHLPSTRTVRLAVVESTSPSRDAGAFGLCVDQPSDAASPTATGFHILTVAPATGYEEEAPKSGLDDLGSAGSCGRRYATLGLKFRMVRFDPAQFANDEQNGLLSNFLFGPFNALINRNMVRNIVAHIGMGTETRAGFTDAPFVPESRWDLEEELFDADIPILASCELPLAVLRIEGGQISYIDMWSLRRAPRTPPVSEDWPLVAASARRALDAATFFQFQDQLAELGAATPLLGPGGTGVEAARYFRYLPPAGFLPIHDASTFFPGSRDPIQLDPGRVIPLVEEALAYPAFSTFYDGEAPVTIYRVGDQPGWLLFVSDVVPSAEREAIKCAELETRIRALEDELAAPGTVTGLALYRYITAAGQQDFPLSNVPIRATSLDDPSVTPIEALTSPTGSYTLSLPAGRYTLDAGGIFAFAPQFARSLDIERGGTVTQNFILNPSSLQLVRG